MSQFDLDAEKATESGESGSDTDDEPVQYRPRLGGRRVRDADAGAPRWDLSPLRARPRVSSVILASTALGLQLRAPDVLLCGNLTCSRPVYPGYLFCEIRCGRLVCPLFLG